MAAISLSDPALDAYEGLAPFYDAYTASYDHRRWLKQLELAATPLGLRGDRALDVGCGTGKSSLPLAERGYRVVACDLSPAMAARARKRLAEWPVEVLVADMRALPQLGEFDLVTCLDDGLNYLLSTEEVEAALSGIAQNLRRGGLFIFDLNSLATYRRIFAAEAVTELDRFVFCWRGHADQSFQPGQVASADLEVRAGRNGQSAVLSRHVQRHYPPALVHELLDAAGLELCELYGQITGARLEHPADENRHVKLVYFARKRRAALPPNRVTRR